MVCCTSRTVEHELISLVYSPWSLKVKWAIKHTGIAVEYTEKPVIEWPLRWRLGISSHGSDGSDGKLTFPILVLKDGTLIRQSLGIARWSHGLAIPGKGLGGKQSDKWNSEIDVWDAKGVQLMRYGRHVALCVAINSDEKCLEMVKRIGLPVPGDSLKIMAGRRANADLLNKYKAEGESSSAEEAASILETLSSHLKTQPSSYILDDVFSYADVAMVLGLHCIRPFREDMPMGLLAPILGVGLEDLAANHESLFTWGQDMIRRHFPEDLRPQASTTSRSKKQPTSDV